MSTPAPTPTPAPGFATWRIPPRLRRWLIRVGVALGVLLVGLIITAPWIASSALVRDYVLSSLNETCRGSFHVDRISTSWFGPTEVWNFRACDPEGRDVLTVAHVRVSRGLLGLAHSWQSLGEGAVENGRIVLYADPDGGMSFVRAFSLRKPSPPSGKPYPAVRVKAKLANISLKLVAADNASWELTRIDGDALVDTLGRYSADLTAAAEGGGKLRVTADVRGLLRKNEFDLFGSTSDVTVKTEEPVEAGRLLALLGLKDTRATLTVTELRAKIQERATDLRWDVGMAGLRRTPTGASARPINVGLSGRISGRLGDPDGLCAGEVKISGDPGDLSAKLLYQRSRLPLDFSLAGIMEAFVSGDTRGLPDVLVEADGSLDLGALGQAAPGLLGLQSDVTLTSGRVDVVRKVLLFTRERVSADGTSVEPPSAQGSVKFSALVASKAGTPFRIEPASFDFQMRILPDNGFEVPRAELKSSFATVVAAGNLRAFAADINADLARLYDQVRPVFRLGSYEFGGTLNVKLDTALPSDNEIRVQRLTADARGLRIRRGGRPLAFDAASLSAKGTIALVNRRCARYEITESVLDLDCTTLARLAGWTDVRTGGLHAAVVVDRADLANVLGKLSDLGVNAGELARWGGRLQTREVLLDRADENAPLVSTGSLTAANPTLDGGTLQVPEATVEWTNAALGARFDNLTLTGATVKSGILTGSWEDVRLAWGDAFTASGRGHVAAQLSAVLPIVSRATRSKALPDLAGVLDWKGDVRWKAPELATSTVATLDDLLLRVGERVERAPKATVRTDARFRVAGGRVTRIETDCATFDVPGRLMGTVAGRVELPDGAFNARLDLTPVDVAFVDTWLRAFGVTALERYAGVVDVNASARRERNDAPVFAEGVASIRGARIDGRPLGIDPASLAWKNAKLGPRFSDFSADCVTLSSTQASARGAGIEADWSGNLRLSGKLNVDADAGQTLGALKMLTGRQDLPSLTGRLSWNGDASTQKKADGATEVTFEGRGETRDLLWRVGGAPPKFVGGTGTFTETAHLAFGESRLKTLVVSDSSLRLPGAFVGSVTLSCSLDDGGFKTSLDVVEADVATAAQWAEAFDVTALKGFGGAAQVRADAARKTSKDPVTSSGSASVTNPTTGGKALPGIGRIDLEWRGATVAAASATKDATLDWVQFNALNGAGQPVASVSAEKTTGRLAPKVQLKGNAVLLADLAAVQPAIDFLGGIKDMERLGGRLDWRGTFDTDGVTTAIDGKGVVDNLRIGEGPTAFLDKRVEVTHHTEINPQLEALALTKTRVTSTPVTADLKGTVEKYKTLRLVDLTGTYSGGWDKIMPLAYQYYPSLRGRVALEGTTGGPFELKGSLRAIGTKPPYLRPGLAGTGRVGWTKLSVTALDYAFVFGPATLTPAMKDGKVTLPATDVSTVPPENGRLRLTGTLDLSQDPPVLTIPGRQTLVENFKIDREFAAKMLNRFNPVFSADAEGRVSVAVQDLVVPLSEEIGDAPLLPDGPKGAAHNRGASPISSLSGSGRVELASLKVNATGFLGEMLKLLALAPDGMYDIPPTGTDFLLRQGRVEYKDFRLQVNEKTDLRFSGNVGLFDDRINMVVSLPGAAAVLGRLGLKGRLAESMAGQRLDIPITGTRRAPVMDLASIIRQMTLGAFERLLNPGGE